MSLTPWHGGVLAAATVVASPALWLSIVEGTLPLDDALTRYLLSVLMCWAALNVVTELVQLGEPRTTGTDQSPEPLTLDHEEQVDPATLTTATDTMP